MIKLHPSKAVNIVAMMFVFGMGLIMIHVNDDLKTTRDQLVRLYEAGFDSCRLTKIEKRKYPGRGDYSVFYTTCSAKNFPILLDKGSDWKSRELFTENAVLTKASKSLDLRIADKGTISNVKLRDPEDEDGRPFGTKVVLIFMGLSTILIILLPNSLYERK